MPPLVSDERAHLEGLLKHPGWLRFLEHARQDWNVGYGQRVKHAIQKARAEQGDVGAAVEKVDYASDEINALLSWPARVLATIGQQVARAEEPIGPSRRGPL